MGWLADLAVKYVTWGNTFNALKALSWFAAITVFFDVGCAVSARICRQK